VLKSSLFVLVGLAVGVGGTLAYHYQFAQPPLAAADGGSGQGVDVAVTTSPVPQVEYGRGDVVALGTLEPRGGIINIGSALVGYRVEKVVAGDGAPVKKGSVLIELDSSVDAAELRLAQLQLAEAKQRRDMEIELAEHRVEAATLALDQLRASTELELAVQKTRLDVLEAKRKQAATDLARLQKLKELPEPLASEQQVEQQSVLVEVARSEHAAGSAGLEQLTQSLEFQLQTAEAEKRASDSGLRLAKSEIGIQALQQKIELQNIKLSHCQIKAPVDGVILKCLAHEGEVVAQAPLMRLAELADNMVCLVEVDAADVQHLRTGQTAKVFSRAFRGTYRQTHVSGTIDRFGSVVANAALRPLDPRKPVDRHVVQVVVSVDADEVLEQIFDESNAESPAALVGLQVEVEFPQQAAAAAESAS
jgi:ABC exporter DevB family membrane fusion protein